LATRVTTTGSGSIGDTITWSATEGVASSIPGETSPTVGSINYTGKTQPDSKLLSDSTLNLTTPDAGQVSGTISQVDIAGPATTVTAFGKLEKFNADFDIPPVESGSIFGALDLATQLTGTKRCTLDYDGGVYWSLQGHSVGFDRHNKRVLGSDNSAARGAITASPFTIEYVDRTIDIKNGALAYGFLPDTHGGGGASLDQAHLYARIVDGNGMDLNSRGTPKAMSEDEVVLAVEGYTKEHIAFRLGPGGRNGNSDFSFRHGYLDTNTARGFYATVRINQSANTISIFGEAADGSPLSSFSVSQSIASIALAKEYQVVISCGFNTTGSSFNITASIADIENLAGKITATVNFATFVGQWTSPWTFNSDGTGMRALYQWNTPNFAHDYLMVDYEVPRDWRVGNWDGESFPEEDRPGYPGNMWLKRKLIPSTGGGFPTLDPFGIPIVARKQNLWQYLNELCADAKAEIAVVKDTIVLRSMDGVLPSSATRRILDVTDRTQPSLSISSLGTGRSIDVAYYDTDLTRVEANPFSNGVQTATSFQQLPLGRSGKFYDAQQDDQTLTVAAGEVTEVRVESKGYPTLLYKPVPSLYWNSPSQWLQFKDSPAFGLGTYIVSDSTGLPINFRQWLDFGGDVNVSFDGETNFITITVTGPRETIPTTTGPYSLAQSDGVNTYPALTIAGRGALGEQKRINVPTGADPARSKQEVATLIDVASAASIGDAYEIAADAIVKASGSFPTINFAIPTNQIRGFGLTAGSVFYLGNSSFRVASVSVGRDVCNISAEYFLPVAQFDAFWNGTDVENFDDLYDGFTVSDFKVSPLGLVD
jgi:hypothetical protein